MNKKMTISMSMLVVILCLALGGPALAGGIDDPKGFPLYVIIEVSWDGVSPKGDWTVWGPKWDPEVDTGTVLSSCTNCLEMDYEFTFRGKTVHFDEVYVPGVNATPQTRHVILTDKDGDLIYTGSLSAQHYTFPTGRMCMDRIDYEITFNENGDVLDFHYFEYEHCKPATFAEIGVTEIGVSP